MRVSRYRPIWDLRDLENSLINTFSNDENTNISSFAPSVNTREDEKNYYIEVDLPGVEKSDIDINVEKNNLLISGERKYKKDIKEENYYKTESFFGKFQRSFTLSQNIDTENIQAKMDNGVLEIIIAKVLPKEAKKIEIL